MLNQELKLKVLKAQRNEITEHIIYKRLALSTRLKEQKDLLEKISADELRHYDFFKTLTGQEVRPDNFKVFLYVLITKVFGLNFGLRLMGKGEDLAQDVYAKIKERTPEIEKIIQDENTHELELLDSINEERLQYVSSMVLGLNDALVELTGALVGLSLALQNTKLVGIVGLITGIAASLSMAASEYLSTKHEDTQKTLLKQVFILVLPT